MDCTSTPQQHPKMYVYQDGMPTGRGKQSYERWAICEYLAAQLVTVAKKEAVARPDPSSG